MKFLGYSASIVAFMSMCLNLWTNELQVANWSFCATVWAFLYAVNID